MARRLAPPDPLDALRAYLWREFEPEVDAKIAEAMRDLRAEFAVEREVLTLEAAAKYLGVRAGDFRRAVLAGEIAPVDVFGRRRFYRPHLDAWAASRRVS